MTDGRLNGISSWRSALAPGERHGFWATPGWWDARDLRRDEEDLSQLRMQLIWSLPPIPDGCHVLDVGAGTGNLVLKLAGFYPKLKYTLIDGSLPALDRAQEKLRKTAPETEISFVAEAINPDASGPLIQGDCRLVVSTIALHDIAPPAPPGDAEGRIRHFASHVNLNRRVLATLEPGGHFIYADAMRPGFRVSEHLDALRQAGFAEVDVAYVAGRFLVCGGQRPQ